MAQLLAVDIARWSMSIAQLTTCTFERALCTNFSAIMALTMPRIYQFFDDNISWAINAEDGSPRANLAKALASMGR